MNTQQQGKPPTQAPIPAVAGLDEDTYVLHEPTVPTHHIRAALGQSKARAVTELRIARLTERHSVATMVLTDDGKGYRLSEAVRVAPHWLREGEDGNVNSRTFMRELAKATLPAHLKFRRDNEDDLGTLRLGDC